MRTNHSNVTEVAHIRTDIDKFAENWERIDWGKKKEEKEEAKKDNEQQEIVKE